MSGGSVVALVFVALVAGFLGYRVSESNQPGVECRASILGIVTCEGNVDQVWCGDRNGLWSEDSSECVLQVNPHAEYENRTLDAQLQACKALTLQWLRESLTDHDSEARAVIEEKNAVIGFVNEYCDADISLIEP